MNISLSMKNNRSNILGLSVSQVPYITYIMSQLFERINPKPKRVLEIGTCHGGLSVLLRIISIQNQFDFHTYDIKKLINCDKLFDIYAIRNLNLS